MLIGSLLSRIPLVQPQHALTHAVALIIVIASAVLGLGYFSRQRH
jgi:hypothetical protein